MLELRRAPARPRQAVIVALGRAVLRPQRDQVEVLLVRHVQLQALRRLAAIAGRPAAAVDLAQDVLGHRHVVLDLDVLEHPVGEAELLGQQIHDLVVVLGLEDRLDDLLAPLQRAVRRRARARASRTGCRSAAGRCRSCARRAPPRWSDADRRPPAARASRCPSAASGMRVTVLPPWPKTIMALRLSFCVDLLLRQHAWRRTSGSTGCRASPSSAWSRSATCIQS